MRGVCGCLDKLLFMFLAWRLYYLFIVNIRVFSLSLSLSLSTLLLLLSVCILHTHSITHLANISISPRTAAAVRGP